MKLKLRDEDVVNAALNAVSTADILNKLGIKPHGRHYNQIKEILQRNGLKTPKKWTKRKWEIITKTCPVCQIIFETQLGSRNEKATCSTSCANTFFRTGVNAGNYKHGKSFSYRDLVKSEGLFSECNRCGYSKIVDILHVHHKDRNRSNNDINNLEVLCPNCHSEEHFISKQGTWHKRSEY